MPIQIQDRDVHVVQEIAECRFLSLHQIAVLCFGGNIETARKRLSKLTAAGILVRGLENTRSIYFLTSRCAKGLSRYAIKSHSIIKPNLATLEHELAVRDFRTSIITVVGKEGLMMGDFSIDSHEISFAARQGVTRPDGYFEICGNRTVLRFFFEIDTGSESYDVLSCRLKNYSAYYRSGGFARRTSGYSSNWQHFPFRVIFLFKTASRREYAAKLFTNLGFRSFAICETWEGSRTTIQNEIRTLSRAAFRALR